MIREMSTQTQQINVHQPLTFTGNWFIDAGILGFVNLMEEVYGWDLEKTQEMIRNEPEKVYYGYFPFAYFYKWLKDRNHEVNYELVDRLEQQLKEKKFNKNEELFDFVWWDFIVKLFKVPKVLWVVKKLSDDKKRIDYNFQSGKEYLEKIEKIIDKIKEEKNRTELEKILDKKGKEKKGKEEKIKYKDLVKLIKNQKSTTNTVSDNLRELIDSLKKSRYELENFLEKEWKNIAIKEKKSSKEDRFYRLPIDFGFYKNFLFFHQNSGISKQKEQFYDVISFNFNEEQLQTINKTVNKLLPSEDKFPNINYTSLSTKLFKDQFEYFFVYLICFRYAFEDYTSKIGNVFFYSNDLKFSYIVNKKLKLMKKRVDASKSKNQDLIFKVTWQQIIDSLVEHKSFWSLENMYIISFQELDNQKQENVDYIGIPKLQASILLDDTIRECLNINIQFRNEKSKDRNKKPKENTRWLILEFIKDKPMYPIILNHILLALNENICFRRSTVLYPLIIEATLLNFRNRDKNDKKTLFEDDFFDNYKFLVDDIKEDVRNSSYSTSLIKGISENADTKNRIARELISTLKAKDKNMFLNVLLKNLNQNKALCANNNLTNWIFEKIIKNNISYEMYGLLLTANLVGEEKNE